MTDERLAEMIVTLVAPDVAASDNAPLRLLWLRKAREVIGLVREADGEAYRRALALIERGEATPSLKGTDA
jgi:hypothetical protein